MLANLRMAKLAAGDSRKIRQLYPVPRMGNRCTAPNVCSVGAGYIELTYGIELFGCQRPFQLGICKSLKNHERKGLRWTAQNQMFPVSLSTPGELLPSRSMIAGNWRTRSKQVLGGRSGRTYIVLHNFGAMGREVFPLFDDETYVGHAGSMEDESKQPWHKFIR